MQRIVWNSGVYCFLNLVNGKRYVGSGAVSLRDRTGNQIGMLRKAKHWNNHLQAAWNKYGESNFIVLYLERCQPIKCVKREQYWIDFYDSANPKQGYNLSPTAGSPLGTKHTAATRKKVSSAMKRLYTKRGHHMTGKFLTEEWRRNISNGNKGKTRSESYRKKISRTLMGHQVSEEARAKMSRSHTGMKPTLEAIEKTAEANRGLKRTEETKKKMSLAQLGKRHSEESRMKMRLAKLGKPLSESHKKSIQTALLRRRGCLCP